MKTDELNALPLEELEAQAAALQAIIHTKRDEQKEQVKAKILKLAETTGLTIFELFGKAEPEKKRGGRVTAAAGVKYRHPDDHALTWTGKGRKPAWLQKWEESGKKLSELHQD